MLYMRDVPLASLLVLQGNSVLRLCEYFWGQVLCAVLKFSILDVLQIFFWGLINLQSFVLNVLLRVCI